jgi:hypothetical protein
VRSRGSSARPCAAGATALPRRWRACRPAAAGALPGCAGRNSPGWPASRRTTRQKIIDHPDVGLITLDCDTLIVAGDDLRITVYTSEPGTEDAERLALAVVLGTQELVDQGLRKWTDR